MYNVYVLEAKLFYFSSFSLQKRMQYFEKYLEFFPIASMTTFVQI